MCMFVHNEIDKNPRIENLLGIDKKLYGFPFLHFIKQPFNKLNPKTHIAMHWY